MRTSCLQRSICTLSFLNVWGLWPNKARSLQSWPISQVDGIGFQVLLKACPWIASHVKMKPRIWAEFDFFTLIATCTSENCRRLNNYTTVARFYWRIFREGWQNVSLFTCLRIKLMLSFSVQVWDVSVRFLVINNDSSVYKCITRHRRVFSEMTTIQCAHYNNICTYAHTHRMIATVPSFYNYNFKICARNFV